MEKITEWKARRSGGRITITGKRSRTGAEARWPNIDTIEPRHGQIIAKDKDGAEYELVV